MVCTATVHVCPLQTHSWQLFRSCVVRVRKVPVLSQHFTHTIEIVGVITHRAHALGLTSFEDILRDHLARHFNTLNLSAFVLESAMLLQEVRIALNTESIAISLPVVSGPLVRGSCVQKRTVVVGPSTVEECKLHLVEWNLV